MSPRSDSIVRANSPQPVSGTVDVEWKATYTVAAAPWYTVVVTGLQSRTGTGSWASANSQQWELRWGNRDKGSLYGPLTTVDDQPVFGFLFPRLVSPDGGCMIYLAYNNGGAYSTVAVVGDSLTQNTYYEWFDGSPNTAAYYDNLNAQYLQGRIERVFSSSGLRVQVEGIGGRRFTHLNDWASGTALAQAAMSMFDEFRGQSKFWLLNRARVVALGANEAFYIAAGATDAEKTTRRDEVATKFVSALVEATRTNTCVVLVTPPRVMQAHTNFTQSQATAYNDAAQYISNMYVFSTLGAFNSSGVQSSRLRIAQFDSESASHAYGTASSWFRSDTIHLNDAGADAYANSIKTAVMTCP